MKFEIFLSGQNIELFQPEKVAPKLGPLPSDIGVPLRCVGLPHPSEQPARLARFRE